MSLLFTPFMTKSVNSVLYYYKLDIKPIRVSIKIREKPLKGFCFVEFENQSIAEKILIEENGKTINDFVLKLNKVNQLQKAHQDYNNSGNSKYTVTS